MVSSLSLPTYVHVEVRGQLQELTTFFLKTGSLAGQGLTNEARLPGWQAWDPLPSHQCWGYMCTPPHLALYFGAGALALTQHVLYRWSHCPSLQLAVTKGQTSFNKPEAYTGHRHWPFFR